MADNKELQEKVDNSALILQMVTALNLAGDRWKEVCRVYADAWDGAFNKHLEVLNKVKAAKEAREKAAADRLKLCFELAAVFLPIVGGPAAIAMAPILTARAQMLAGVVEKRTAAAWKSFATSSPVTSKVVAEIGKRSKDEAKAAAEKIQKGVLDYLTPKYTDKKAPPAKTEPVTAFTDNNNRTRDFMNGWVNDCAKWNVEGGWIRKLIPAAHELLLNHPWVKNAPATEPTQALRAPLTSYIEMSLWLRWARGLDENHWKSVHEWYTKDYSVKSLNDRVQMVQNRSRRMAIELLDYRSLYLHFAYNFPRDASIQQMKILDPRDGFPGEDVSINLYPFIMTAKHSSAPVSLLKRLMPAGSVNDEFARELVAM